ncbi:hypothetical protein ZIOFF_007104 [Zingiber officinale]|uniref:BHLH domain-containing protein n=1 Tax=Zingiber officinale TaxID=94328 RepID=A0A8J5HPH4_ZINOF|nr:hypothetical protein ZIOFF_007104 [Zingiber officinale]
MNHSPSGGDRPAAMGPPPGLARYGSAPGSFLGGIADSVIAAGGSERMMTRFYAGDSPCLTSESSCWAPDGDAAAAAAAGGCSRGSYGSGELQLSSATGSPLVRHSSLPTGFFSHLLADHAGNSSTRMIGNYSQAGTESIHVLAHRRQHAPWGFSRQDSLSQISELSIPEMEESDTHHDSDEVAGNAGQSYISSNFQLGSWDDKNSIAFSAPQSKRIKCDNGDAVASLGNIDSQFSFPRTSSEMSELEKYLQIQQDSVPCRARAKRGCATHPRSIAERERRTRISKRLQKLQDLVPNMDKQTSTSDMLELAIQHIKELQGQVEKLKQEQTNCTCTAKQEKA